MTQSEAKNGRTGKKSENSLAKVFHSAKPLLIFYIVILEISFFFNLNAQEKIYTCFKIPDNAIKIDGELNEDIWHRTPEIELNEMITGTTIPFLSRAKLLWDNQFLYVGYHFADTDVFCRARPGVDYRSHSPRHKKHKKWGPGLCDFYHPFAKFFLDPDNDGVDRIELHMDAMGHFCDLLQVIPGSNSHVHLKPYKLRDGWGWDLKGTKVATHVYGTLNDSSDVDSGWSVELAIPWSGLRDITKGNCPPKPGEQWSFSVQRTIYVTPKCKRIYATWPRMGILDSHVINRYGKLLFSDTEPNSFKWKLVWIKNLPDSSDMEVEEAVLAAKALGFTSVAWDTQRWEALIYACRTHGLESWGIIRVNKKNSPNSILTINELDSQVKEAVMKGYTGIMFTDWAFNACIETKRVYKKILVKRYQHASAYARSYASTSPTLEIKTGCLNNNILSDDLFYKIFSGMDYWGENITSPGNEFTLADLLKNTLSISRGNTMITPCINISQGTGNGQMLNSDALQKYFQSIKNSGFEGIQVEDLGILLKQTHLRDITAVELGGNWQAMKSFQRRIKKALYDETITGDYP